ncbi:MAG: amidohydrolase family protein, partial [Chloroflexota bacterium]
MFDTLIKNGTIIDGDKTPRYRADVAINGDQVVQIGDFSDADARQVIDATGKMIAPGFVDTHNHSDGWLLKVPYLVSKTTQGFTSEVIMADGISYAPLAPHTAHDWIYYMRTLNAITFEEYTGWQTLAEYMALLDGTNVQNSITHIPYANVRTLAFGGTGGWGQLPPDDYQMSLILREMEMGMEAGAVGVSTGLDYVAQFFATTDELVEACAPLVEKQGLYVTHVRYKKGTLAGVQEAVEIGKRAGIPVHISHFKGTTPQEVDELLTYVDTVATQEVDFSFDVYPYLPGSTMLNYLLPYEVWTDGPLGVIRHLKRPDIRQQFTHSLQQLPLDATHIAWVGGKDNHHHQGKMLSTYIAERGMSAGDAMADLLIEENLAVLLVISKGAEHDT